MAKYKVKKKIKVKPKAKSCKPNGESPILEAVSRFFGRKKYLTGDVGDPIKLKDKLNLNLNIEASHTHDGQNSKKLSSEAIEKNILKYSNTHRQWQDIDENQEYSLEFITTVEKPFFQFYFKSGNVFINFYPSLIRTRLKHYKILTTKKLNIEIHYF